MFDLNNPTERRNFVNDLVKKVVSKIDDLDYLNLQIVEALPEIVDAEENKLYVLRSTKAGYLKEGEEWVDLRIVTGKHKA